jgi:hypothetical protein
MTRSRRELSRRAFLASMGALGAAVGLGRGPASAAPRPLLSKAIPATGERLPVIGMGSWLTFDVGQDEMLRAGRLRVLQAFFDKGGAVIDSSPMYGSSEEPTSRRCFRRPRCGRFFSPAVCGRWRHRGDSGARIVST